MESTGGTQWRIDNNGNTEDVDFAAVYDSYNIAAAPANEIAAAESFDGGNNINWNISGSGSFKTWVGGDAGNESSWNTGNNWNPVGVPGAGATVIIPSSATYMPVLDIASVTITNMTIQAGASLDIAGNSLTVTGNFENLGILYRQGGDFVNQTDIDSGSTVYRTTGGAIQDYGNPNVDYYNYDREIFAINLARYFI